MIDAEAGSDVLVKTRGTKLEVDYVAKNRPRTLSQDVRDGRYIVTVSVTDAAGNLGERRASVKIA